MMRAFAILVTGIMLFPAAVRAEIIEIEDPLTGNVFRYVVAASGLGYTPLGDNDADAGRYDVVLIGDGYDETDADQARFTAAAIAFKSGLFRVAPYSAHATSINVWAVNLVSPASGVTDPDNGFAGNTALKCSFTSGSMLITGMASEALAIGACTTAGLEYDAIFVLLHDKYNHDGASASYASQVAFASDQYPWGTVIGHELGHLIGNLADEYITVSCYTSSTCVTPNTFAAYSLTYAPEVPNLTNATDAALVPWADLMTSRSLPTTRDNAVSGTTVGRWEGGGREWCFGIYRPCEYCLMDGVTGENPETDTFCPVCSRVVEGKLALYAPPPP